MYLADTTNSAAMLKECQEIQAKLGAGTKHMSASQIKDDYPFICWMILWQVIITSLMKVILMAEPFLIGGSVQRKRMLWNTLRTK